MPDIAFIFFFVALGSHWKTFELLISFKHKYYINASAVRNRLHQFSTQIETIEEYFFVLFDKLNGKYTRKVWR